MEFIAATQPGHWGDENALPPRKLLFAELCAARDARKITTLGQFCAPSGKKGVLNILIIFSYLLRSCNFGTMESDFQKTCVILTLIIT